MYKLTGSNSLFKHVETHNTNAQCKHPMQTHCKLTKPTPDANTQCKNCFCGRPQRSQRRVVALVIVAATTMMISVLHIGPSILPASSVPPAPSVLPVPNVLPGPNVLPEPSVLTSSGERSPSLLQTVLRQDRKILQAPAPIEKNMPQFSDKTILLWTPYFRKSKYYKHIFSRLMKKQCPVSACHVTTKHDQLAKADLVIFHLLDFKKSTVLPSYRPLDQPWLVFTFEAPPAFASMAIDYERLSRVVNWTMSYRWDSDVVTPYGVVVKRDGKDYVTEKFFLALNRSVVPVVFGSADYSIIAPPNSYINALDYGSPQQLAQFLLATAANKTAYNSYFEWRTDYTVDLGHPFSPHVCDLCAKLHGAPLQHSRAPLENSIAPVENSIAPLEHSRAPLAHSTAPIRLNDTALRNTSVAVQPTNTDSPLPLNTSLARRHRDLRGWFLSLHPCDTWNLSTKAELAVGTSNNKTN